MLKTEHSRMRVVAYQKQKVKEYVIGRSRLRNSQVVAYESFWNSI